MYYDELTPYVLLNSSALSWLQKQDDDEDKSQLAAGREFQAAEPQTAKLRNQNHYSQGHSVF